MKRLIFTIGFLSLLVSAAFARQQTVLARVTVYWRGEGQMRAAWNGARLREGHCAVDPGKIPFGSKVMFADGVECKAVDTGPAIVSRSAARSSGRTAAQRNAIVVDRFFETKTDALAWSDTHGHFMTLQVTTPGSDKEEVPKSEKALVQNDVPNQTETGSTNTVAASLPLVPSTNDLATSLPAIPASTGLQTLDATLLALLPFLPFLGRLVWRRRFALQRA